MRRLTFAKYEFYHLYNRGVDKRALFTTKADFDRFEAYLYLLNDEDPPRAANFFTDDRKSTVYESRRASPLVSIVAYTLLPDRFDLVVTPIAEDGVSKFMQKVQTAYTMYFNKKRAREGRLFAGTFKAERAATEFQMRYLFALVHMLPLSLIAYNWDELPDTKLQSISRKLFEYHYSSAKEYHAGAFTIVDPSPLPKQLKKLDPISLARTFRKWQNKEKASKTP